MLVNAQNIFPDLAQRFTGCRHEFTACLYFGTGFSDQGLDILGGAGGTAGEFADFLRHDRKTLAGFACAGCFDAGVEGEEVGLEGDLIDDVDDRSDLARGRGDSLHGGHGVGDDHI